MANTEQTMNQLLIDNKIPLAILGKQASDLLADWPGDDMDTLIATACEYLNIRIEQVQRLIIGEFAGHDALWVYIRAC